MSLTTYTEARPWARAIREEMLERQMPPWQAVRRLRPFRQRHQPQHARDGDHPVVGRRRRAERRPEGRRDRSRPCSCRPRRSWDHGAPDLVLPIGNGQSIAGGAPFEVKRFVVPPSSTRPKRVRAIALKQGDRRVVRHAAFYDEASGRWLGAWTPWQTAGELPDGLAYRLPAKARIVVEIGYSGADEDVTDTSELGLYFASGTATALASDDDHRRRAGAPAGTTAQRVRTETTLARRHQRCRVVAESGRRARGRSRSPRRRRTA